MQIGIFIVTLCYNMLTKGFYIALLFITSLVFQPNEVMACNKHDAAEKAVSAVTDAPSCCEAKAAVESKSCCCSAGENGEDECPGDCGGPSCHCVSPTFMTSQFESIKISFISTKSLISYVWNYQSVNSYYTFNSIWQPPQFS